MNVAIAYAAAGLSVLPVRKDKRPALSQSWAPFQTRIATAAEIESWGKQEGIGIICGAVSGAGGHLICIDIDNKHDPLKTIDKEYFALIREWGYDAALRLAVVERTPSGGFHVVFRAPFSRGCEKLAHAVGKTEAMIEVKGEGGYFVAAPTHGWDLLSGDFCKVPTFDSETANAFLSAAWALDRKDAPPEEPVRKETHEGKSPFDDYNDRATVDDMLGELQAHGWRKVGQRGENMLLVRPGKEGRDYGATLHVSKRRFYVFTSSSDFDQGKGYNPVAVYAKVNHGGDFSAAARALVAKGYGDKRDFRGTKTKEEKTLPLDRLLLNMDSLDLEIFAAYSAGRDQGLLTEWKSLEYRIAENQLTVVTGYPSSGKSSFIQSVAVHLAKAHGWRFVIASMEDYPNKRLGGKLIRKYARQPMYGQSAMTFDEYKASWAWVKEHFVFVNAAADEVTLTRILEETGALNLVKRVNGLILDPWSEMDEDRPIDATETDFIKVSLKRARKFARANAIATWILAHPTKPRRTQDGGFPDVDLYDIAGSHQWRAKCDNGLVIKRDLKTNVTTVHMQKIKFHDYGRIGASCDLKFDIPSECYSEMTAHDIFGAADKGKAAANDVL